MPRQAEEIGKRLPSVVDAGSGMVWNIPGDGNPNRNSLVVDQQREIRGCNSLGHPNPEGTAAPPTERPMAVRFVCGSLRTTKGWLMPTRERENDAGGRFTKRPFGESQGRLHLSSVFSSVSASLAGPVTPARKSPTRTGATPCFECPVWAWAGVGFHKPTPALSGGRSRS